MAYTAKYAHNSEATPGTLELKATTDSEAVEELRQFVAEGMRNGTWASVDMQDGRACIFHNQHGAAVGGLQA